MLESEKSVNDRRLRRTIVGSLDAISITGPFDFNDSLLLVLAQQIIDEGKQDFAIDLSGTTYISSPGIAALIKIVKKLQSVNGRLTITGASDDMVDYLQLACIDKFIHFVK